jgi:hypothetical protein
MIKSISLFLLITNLSLKADSYVWPIQTDKIYEKITSVFGESRGDHFHNGLDVSSDNEPIVSIGDGDIVYSRFESDHPFEGEFGSGNCVWVYHGKKTLSAYYHMKSERKQGLLDKLSVKKGDLLGKSGNSGHSSGSHLHFIVANENGKKLINPLLILSPIEDKKPPQIGSLILSIGENYTYINDGDNIRISKPFPVTVQINDFGEKKGQRRGIYSVEFFFNGRAIKSSLFNEISLQGQFWKNESGLRFDELYFEGNYYISDLNFNPGVNTIFIKAADFHGNKIEKTFTFNVNRIK